MDADAQHTVSCIKLVKKYRNSFQLGPLNVALRRGKVTGMFGPNGAGKSTLISLLLGSSTPTSGTIYYNPSVRSFAGVLEHKNYLPFTTVWEQLDSLRRLLRVEESTVRHVMAKCGIDKYADRQVSKLSLGNQQRLSVASALLQNPEFAVFDEPLNGLDPHGIDWINQTIREYVNSGRTVLLATHLLAEAEHIVDDCIFIDQGMVRYFGSVRHALELAANAPNFFYFKKNKSETLGSGGDRSVVWESNTSAIVHIENESQSAFPAEQLRKLDPSALTLQGAYRILSANSDGSVLV